ncbi:ATP synthase F1 subunit gamma [Candidatus Daviesbacteria bacterium]|nr:ATP synthase F1 subunit gamma [Candidatus Daviesbacteria bacterium]
MANTRELRRRIRSVKNTSQITKAMQMVAATKMRKAQAQALSGRPYDLTLAGALAKLSSNVQPELSPLLQPHDGLGAAVLLLTTDKSLCGALNTNIFRMILMDSRFRGNNSLYYTVGKKGRNFVIRTGNKLEADFENPEIVTFRQAKQIAKLLIETFLSGGVGEVYIIYPDFISTLKQEPKIVKLLPINVSVVTNPDTAHLRGEDKVTSGSHLGGVTGGEFLFDPNPNDLLDFVLNHQIETKIYQALLETKASEHSARMIAMQNATDNAKELVEDLQLSYNQTRQAGITNELLEITSAQAALE